MIFQTSGCKAASIATIVFSSLLVACATGKSELTPSSLPIVHVALAQAQEDESLTLLAEADGSVFDRGSDTRAVRWGGTIARVQNRPEEITLLEIVSRPLSGSGRPRHNDKTFGRFVAVVQEFLDPEIYKKGRDITVTGPLISRQSGKIGETDYIFPVLEAETYTFWKKQMARTQRHFPHWSSYPRYDRDPFYSPWPH